MYSKGKSGNNNKEAVCGCVGVGWRYHTKGDGLRFGLIGCKESRLVLAGNKSAEDCVIAREQEQEQRVRDT